MEADEHPNGSPFDHYTKIQALINKAKTEEGINFAFTAVQLCSSLLDDVKKSLDHLKHAEFQVGWLQERVAESRVSGEARPPGRELARRDRPASPGPDADQTDALG